MHYVIGGKGDPLVLLHGWPETWYGWHKVMPALAKNYTVIAPDPQRPRRFLKAGNRL